MVTQKMCSWNHQFKAIGEQCNSQRVRRWLRQIHSSLSSKSARKFQKWRGQRAAKFCWRQVWFSWWVRLLRHSLGFLIGCSARDSRCCGAFSLKSAEPRFVSVVICAALYAIWYCVNYLFSPYDVRYLGYWSALKIGGPAAIRCD